MKHAIATWFSHLAVHLSPYMASNTSDVRNLIIFYRIYVEGKKKTFVRDSRVAVMLLTLCSWKWFEDKHCGSGTVGRPAHAPSLPNCGTQYYFKPQYVRH